MLSGDHMKTSSDLGLPLVGVGLLYRQGYFQQYLNMDGFQQESYPENDWYNMPVTLCRDAKGAPVGRDRSRWPANTVTARVWEVKVGKNSLYLLDTNIEANPPADRLITAAAVRRRPGDAHPAGDPPRASAGIRALCGAGHHASWPLHMNEGHSAFLGLERIRELHAGEEAVLGPRRCRRSGPPTSSRPIPPCPRATSGSRPTLMEKYFRGDGRRAGPALEGLPRPGPGRPRTTTGRSSASPSSRCACPRSPTA